MKSRWSVVGGCGFLLIMASAMGAQGVTTKAEQGASSIQTLTTAPAQLPANAFAVTRMPVRLAQAPESGSLAELAVGSIATHDALDREAAAAVRRGGSAALMIVGGAGIVTGLLLNEDVITVAGAVIWLYGLWVYLR